ncbi:MAG: efflux RND transporter periplasmic adaptor subunit [Lysobacterales bacterium]|nr:efflux RND transporter periplasmic adaptor subunit [Xanthomonadales bacterium]MCB1611171.1 efflux RND transporter periplasmic adaptor subunit [Xanthomonadales bacterium]MCP5476914.1 efflux RND transporter periplasmic adaptor subunit [Rhodanobacteraceae bacterium]
MIMERRHRSIPTALIVAISLSLAACGGPAADQSADGTEKTESQALGKDGKPVEAVKVPVEVATATRAPVSAAFQGTANLEAAAEADVVTKTSGVVLEIMVEEGDQVRAGQVLARLDSDRQRLSVKQSEANLRKLENDYKRQQEMFARKLISQDVFDRSRFDLDTQRAAHDMSKLELSYTEIRAPISGVVSKRMVKVGNLIQLNQPLFKIDDFDPLEAMINVPEREMRLIKAEQPVQMLVDALPDAVFTGSVARVSPVVDSNTGTFRVVAQFKDPTGRLRTGMFGRVRIVYDERADALVVPRSALVGDDKDASVFVVEDGTAKRRQVRLGYADGGQVEVVDGMSEGEQVVTLGQAALRDGSKVQIINPEEPVAVAKSGG